MVDICEIKQTFIFVIDGGDVRNDCMELSTGITGRAPHRETNCETGTGYEDD
ncbi:hypothetical protein FH972_012926 [Carpinus fangiana]|uniref:Uncharacterized protein n=1 Tax=Carpinus fangiana TaxID=176857 RepID=A0A5N6R599_9ROSI|nr:hypothetical protein FH972_012926 [Carpinus fangiana]